MTDATPQSPAAERWRTVPVEGFEDYEVSDLGRVRSWKKWRGKRGHLITPWANVKKGYLTVSLGRGEHKAVLCVHRLVMLAFVGPRPPEMQVRHLDGVKSNNTLGNLTYGTAAENAHDKAVHGGYYQSNKTHCIHGHEFTSENTYIGGDGRRKCKACWADRSRARHLRIKQAKSAGAA